VKDAVDHHMTDVAPMQARGGRGFSVHCSCGPRSQRILTAGLASSAYEEHLADPDDRSEGLD